MSTAILVVEDEPGMQEVLGSILRFEGYEVATAGSGEEAVAHLEAQEFDVIVTDLVLPGLSGLDVLERSSVLNPHAAVVLMTAYATVESAIEALKKGACDYLQKPFDMQELTGCVKRLLQNRRALDDMRVRRRLLHPGRVAEGLVGESDAMQSVRHQIARCAGAPTNVLITGESGVGKELVARAIHAASPRHDRPFVPVNCGAIPEALLESQLFGHVRGAFTSANQANPGLFAVANEGTLFLDEIGELPFLLQVKLLRVIEDKQIWAVGATRPVPVDVRIIASTNRDLVVETGAGRFRADLYYRLNVVHITLPPLRERRTDIALLADHFVRRLNLKLGTTFTGVDRDALRVLLAHPWHGNVRELENVLERAMLLSDDDVIRVDDLVAGGAPPAPSPPLALRDAVRDFERSHVLDVLARHHDNKREAARALGISLASLYRKLALEPDPPLTEE
jgi:DNA-binding NtrC family response regulator